MALRKGLPFESASPTSAAAKALRDIDAGRDVTLELRHCSQPAGLFESRDRDLAAVAGRGLEAPNRRRL